MSEEAVEQEETEAPTEPEPSDPDPEPEPKEAPEPGDKPETDAPPEELGPSDEQRQRMIDKGLERENKRHERALSALYGDEWDSLVTCPLCVGDGFFHPWQPGELPEEQLQAIDALSGRHAPPEYIEDTDYEKCDHCDGHGHTITGSQNPEHITKLCDKCAGNGYVKKSPSLVVPLPAPAPIPGVVPATEPVPNYGATGPDDAWGRPAGHAHYGLDPRYVTG